MGFFHIHSIRQHYTDLLLAVNHCLRNTTMLRGQELEHLHMPAHTKAHAWTRQQPHTCLQG